MSLTRKDVLHLLYPNEAEESEEEEKEEQGSGGGGGDCSDNSDGEQDSIGDLNVDDLLGRSDSTNTTTTTLPAKGISDGVLLGAMKQLGAEVSYTTRMK